MRKAQCPNCMKMNSLMTKIDCLVCSNCNSEFAIDMSDPIAGIRPLLNPEKLNGFMSQFKSGV